MAWGRLMMDALAQRPLRFSGIPLTLGIFVLEVVTVLFHRLIGTVRSGEL